MFQGAFGAANAGGGDLQAGGAEPVIGDLEALVQFAEDLRLVQAAIVEFENAVVVAAMRDVLVAVAHGEALGALVDEEGGDQLLLAARRILFAGCGKEDGEGGFIGMADEMLGAVDDEIIAILLGEAFHAAHVGAHARLGHGEAIHHFSLNGGEEIFFALFADAGHEDVGGPRDAVPMQRVIGAAQFLFVENPGQRIEAGAARFGRHVGGIEAGGDGLGLDFLAQSGRSTPVFSISASWG